MTKNNFWRMLTNSEDFFDQVWLKLCLECCTPLLDKLWAEKIIISEYHCAIFGTYKMCTSSIWAVLNQQY